MVGLVNEADKPGQIDQFDSIRDVERLLVEAAKAIQRLISERDELRSRVDALEGEAASLRERTTLIQESYRNLANEFVTQLQLIEGGARELFREPTRPETLSQIKETAPGGSS